MDLYEAIMATELKKDKTYFMPFNQGSGGAGRVGGAGNPECEDPDDYATSYLWRRVLRRDMLLSILQRYISRQEEEITSPVRKRRKSSSSATNTAKSGRGRKPR